MKAGLLHTLLGLCLLLSLNSCIREHLDDCPPLSLVFFVEDKNYVNIDDAKDLGLLEPKAENLPFADYVQTLHIVVTDTEERIVFEQKNAPVSGGEEQLRFVFPVSLPYGKYEVKAWGNLKSEAVLHEGSRGVYLEQGDACDEDIYLAAATVDYQYGQEEHELGMQRTKGNLLVQVENVSEHVNYSTQSLQQVMSAVDWHWNYSEPVTKQAAHDWTQTRKFVTQTLAGPSPQKDGTVLQVRFWAKDAAGQLDPLDREVPVPDAVGITLTRNTLTILKYVYDDTSGDFLIYVYVNDEWQRIHSMEID